MHKQLLYFYSLIRTKIRYLNQAVNFKKFFQLHKISVLYAINDINYLSVTTCKSKKNKNKFYKLDNNFFGKLKFQVVLFFHIIVFKF